MTQPDPLRAALHDNPEWPCSCSGLYDENRHTAAVRVALAADTAPLDWPTLANIIREVDGNHDLGAGELAERILAHPRFAARPESVRAASERLGIAGPTHDLPMDVVRPAPCAADTAPLDAAWAEIEAVLPEGWEMHLDLSLWRRGWVAYASQYQLAAPGEPGRQRGDPYIPLMESIPYPDAHPTPADALRALAVRLAKERDQG